MPIWTTQKPSQSGWYWMLDPTRESGLPTIVRIASDRENNRWLVLIPASHYPKASGMELDLQTIDALWSGPLEIPSVDDPDHKQSSDGSAKTDIAA